MPPRRGSLGRGLDALLAPTSPIAAEPGAGPLGVTVPQNDGAPAAPTEPETRPAAVEVEIGRIERNPRQPRRHMDEAQLDELAASVREHGLLQPLLVSRLESGAGGPPRYQLIAGERRWEAARRAGLVRVPVVVREATPRQFLELALVENVQRADLNPLEEAAAYQQLTEEFGLTQEQIGQRVGKSRFAVANTQRLLQLPASVQQTLLGGQLTEGHARAVLQLRDRELQRRTAQEIVEQGLSVRQAEELVRRLQEASSKPAVLVRRPGRPARPAEVRELEERFQEALGTKVSLSRSSRGGRLVIYFYDDEQLQGLYDRLRET